MSTPRATVSERALLEQNIALSRAFSSLSGLVVRLIDSGDLLQATTLLREAEATNDHNATSLDRILKAVTTA